MRLVVETRRSNEETRVFSGFLYDGFVRLCARRGGAGRGGGRIRRGSSRNRTRGAGGTAGGGSGGGSAGGGSRTTIRGGEGRGRGPEGDTKGRSAAPPEGCSAAPPEGCSAAPPEGQGR